MIIKDGDEYSNTKSKIVYKIVKYTYTKIWIKKLGHINLGSGFQHEHVIICHSYNYFIKYYNKYYNKY